MNCRLQLEARHLYSTCAEAPEPLIIVAEQRLNEDDFGGLQGCRLSGGFGGQDADFQGFLGGSEETLNRGLGFRVQGTLNPKA